MATDLRRIVLDTAAALVAERGIDALSLRDVARRAGVSHQAPYKHFADREAVFAALAEDGFRRLAEALEALDVAEPTDRLAASGRAYVSFALGSPGHYRVMFRPDLFALEAHPATAAAAARAMARLQALAALLSDGDPETDAALVWSVSHGIAMLLLDGPLPSRTSMRSPEALAGAVTARFAGLVRG